MPPNRIELPYCHSFRVPRRPVILGDEGEAHSIYGSTDHDLDIINDKRAVYRNGWSSSIRCSSTKYKDFGELVYRNRESHFGVLLLRLADGEIDENATATSAVLAEHGDEMRHRFSVLTPRGLRIKKVIA